MKFDTDVGSRANECDELDVELKEMRSKFDHFKATTWSLQDEMYNRMLQMQEDERNAQLEEIRVNHAAKVIQKHWRKFRKQKEGPKQKGTGKKKK